MWKHLSDGLEDDFQSGTTPARPEYEKPIRKRRRIDESKKEDATLEPFVWFTKQREALEEVHRWEATARVFTEEDKNRGNGSRRYLVTTVDRFWREYSGWREKYHYELISENEKCRLFFDLEYMKERNQDVDEIRCVDHFIQCCIELLFEMYNIEVTRDKFLLLDSSSLSKFSMHITVHLPVGRLFLSVVSIKSFAIRLRNRSLEDPPQRVMNADGTKEAAIFDLSVYTRNRNFRLFLSSKADKGIPLVRSPRCKFYPPDSHPSDREVFLDSLCVPIDWKDQAVIEEIKMEKKEIITKYSDRVLGEGGSRSPFPLLDEFIVNVLSKWRPNETIKRWKVEGDEIPSAITYYPSLGRYCFNIGREHRSNGTYWRADLLKGTVVQKCFDVDCRGASSNVFPIPPMVLNDIRKIVPMPNEERNMDRVMVKDEGDATEVFYDQWDTIFEC